jgi:uncharacterized membrane protein YhhN
MRGLDFGTLLPLLPLAAAASAGAAVAAYYLPASRIWLYLFKPLTTLLILGTALAPGGLAGGGYAAAIAIGLVFSLAGDVLLMLPKKKFLAGLVCFLCAHLGYCSAFLIAGAAARFPWPVVPLAAVGIGMLAFLRPGLPAAMRAPVGGYIAVIVAMAALAANRALLSPSAGSLAAAAGALLFMLSDGILAADRFRRPFRAAEGLILASYFAAQLLIALSIG